MENVYRQMYSYIFSPSHMVFEIAVTFMLSYNSSVHLEAVTEPKCQNGTLCLCSLTCFLTCATGATIYTGESNWPVITAVWADYFLTHVQHVCFTSLYGSNPKRFSFRKQSSSELQTRSTQGVYREAHRSSCNVMTTVVQFHKYWKVSGKFFMLIDRWKWERNKCSFEPTLVNVSKWED